MLRSLVGSEMCIRDRRWVLARKGSTRAVKRRKKKKNGSPGCADQELKIRGGESSSLGVAFVVPKFQLQVAYISFQGEPSSAHVEKPPDSATDTGVGDEVFSRDDLTSRLTKEASTSQRTESDRNTSPAGEESDSRFSSRGQWEGECRSEPAASAPDVAPAYWLDSF